MAEVHVAYEVKGVAKFLVCGNALPPMSLKPGAPRKARAAALDWKAWIQSSVLEATLVHVRNVSDFLTKSRPTNENYKTDLVADQYFAHGWSSRPDYIFGADKDEHKELLDEIHRRVVHLSTQRHTIKDDGDFVWREYVIKQFPALLPAFRKFLNDLTACEPERALWFGNCDALLTSYRV